MPLRRAHRRARLGRLAGRRLAAVLGLAACAWAFAPGCVSAPPPRGAVHVVRPGETVWRIAHRYGVATETVIRANRIRDVHSLRVGQRLWIPGGRRGAGSPLPPPRSQPASVRPSDCRRAEHEAGLRFAWPVRGTLTSRFGRRGRGRHEGIDLAAPSGTPIHAAEAGRVIHSGRGLGDYGNVVIIKHAGRWATVYAHNRRNRVRKGAFVEKGDVIGEVGRTGNATGSHVHFEVRRGDVPQNPLACLP